MIWWRSTRHSYRQLMLARKCLTQRMFNTTCLTLKTMTKERFPRNSFGLAEHLSIGIHSTSHDLVACVLDNCSSYAYIWMLAALFFLDLWYIEADASTGIHPLGAVVVVLHVLFPCMVSRRPGKGEEDVGGRLDESVPLASGLSNNATGSRKWYGSCREAWNVYFASYRQQQRETLTTTVGFLRQKQRKVPCMRSAERAS